MKKLFFRARSSSAAEDDAPKSPRSPRSPRSKSPRGSPRLLRKSSPGREEAAAAVVGCASLELLSQLPSARRLRARHGRWSAMLVPGVPQTLWLSEEEPKVTLELVAERSERPTAASFLSLPAAAEDWTSEVALGELSLRVRARRGNERAGEAGAVRMVAGGQDVALLFDSLRAPLGLLSRAARATAALGWPVPLLLEGQAHFCPRLFAKPVRDETRCSASPEDKRDIDERDCSLANCALTLLSALYSHGYREQTRGFWLAEVAPLPALLPGCAFCCSSDSVTLWGAFPAPVVAALVAEHTDAPFAPLASAEGGCGMSGQTHRFSKQLLGKTQTQGTIVRMKQDVQRLMRLQGTFLQLPSWSLSVFFFLQVAAAAAPPSQPGKAPSSSPPPPPPRSSMGSRIEDAQVDPALASSSPELGVPLGHDITGLVSDVYLRKWPLETLPLAAALARAGVADAVLAVAPSRTGESDARVLPLHRTAAWRAVAWRGARPLRLLKQRVWLAVAEACAARGFAVPAPHFALHATQFAPDASAAAATAHAFVTLLVDRERGAFVEVHCLGRAAEFAEKLKLLIASGSLSQADEDVLLLKVPHSRVLVADPVRATAKLLDDQFADDRSQEKARRTAESRCFAVLMRALGEVCNACGMEALTTSWRQTLPLALASLAVLNTGTRAPFTAADEPPAMSYLDDTPAPDFARIHWEEMTVQGFVLRQALPPRKTRWIRVCSSGKFSDIHGDFKQREAEALLEGLEHAKVVAARDEKKNLICWSIAHGDGGKQSGGATTERMLEESRTFGLVVKLRAQGWLLGPEGADHAEVILFFPEQ